ncbi:MAG: 30S ribosomal protein S5 [candidate division WOR-3 bacterium]|nr:30S ribosomal protein S5 [candidate division WOR-3 bacterium]MDH5684275.1 30S ribosomal protein S5 [candidate division WOR-3 bacterium]
MLEREPGSGISRAGLEATVPIPEFIERVIEVKRVSKVVKGGKRMRISATVVAGDGKGHIGVGHGKASEVAQAVRKASLRAKKSFFLVSTKGNTIPHAVTGKYSASRVLLKPASTGTGLVACPKVRAVLEAAGIKDCLTKSLGSNNSYNIAIATLNGLRRLRNLEQIARFRNKPISHFVMKKGVESEGDISQEPD